MNIAKELHQFVQSDLITEAAVKIIFQNWSCDAKKSFLKRLVKKREIVRLRRSLYMLGNENQKFGIHAFEVANYLYPHSYVSLESALSHYNLIPEAVYETTSVSTKRNKEYENILGRFSYQYLPLEQYNFGYYKLDSDYHKYFIASPLKALMDYIIVRKKKYLHARDIEEDLRFDFEEFVSLNEFVNKEKLMQYRKKYQIKRAREVLDILLKEVL